METLGQIASNCRGTKLDNVVPPLRPYLPPPAGLLVVAPLLLGSEPAVEDPPAELRWL